MLRIAPGAPTATQVTLILEGQIIGPWVEELRRSCEPNLLEGGRLTLDLSAVSFADRDGVALLRNLAKRNVLMRDPSPFVAKQIDAQGGPGHER